MMDNILLIEMGQRISRKRKELGYTQEQLAELVNVSTNMISNLERGKKAIRPENLISVAKALKTSTDYILNGESTIFDRDNLFNRICSLSEKDYKIVEHLVKYLSDNEK